VEGVSLLKKSPLTYRRPQIGLEAPQKRRVWCRLVPDLGVKASTKGVFQQPGAFYEVGMQDAA
jgi:hypothetical protein